MHDIADQVAHIDRLQADLDEAMSRRDAAIRRAVGAGHRVADVADVARVTRQQVYTICGGGRHRGGRRSI